MRAKVHIEDSMKRSLVVSAAAHVLLLILLYVGMPQLFKPLPKPYIPIPLQIVDISDITNTRLKEPEEQVKPPEPPAKPEPPKPQPEQKAQPAPQPPQPKPPEPVKPEQVEALAKPKIMPKPKPKPKPEEAKQPQPDAFASVLKNVQKLKPMEASKAPPDAKATPTKAAQEVKSLAPVVSTRLTISQEDALRRQIQQCWNMPIGARDAESLIVEITIDVNPDRTVQHAEVVDSSRMSRDPYFRSAAEAALRALYNPRCSPLVLPPDGYDQWKRIDFTFDPRDML